MKVSLGGRYRIDEFAAAIGRVIDNFRANGVDEIHSVNLYLYIYQAKRAVKLVDEDGNEIEHLRFDGPHERRFTATTANVRVAKGRARLTHTPFDKGTAS